MAVDYYSIAANFKAQHLDAIFTMVTAGADVNIHDDKVRWVYPRWPGGGATGRSSSYE